MKRVLVTGGLGFIGSGTSFSVLEITNMISKDIVFYKKRWRV